MPQRQQIPYSRPEQTDPFRVVELHATTRDQMIELLGNILMGPSSIFWMPQEASHKLETAF
jgi:hypothetical protein